MCQEEKKLRGRTQPHKPTPAARDESKLWLDGDAKQLRWRKKKKKITVKEERYLPVAGREEDKKNSQNKWFATDKEVKGP